MKTIALKVNGKDYGMDVEPTQLLSEVLRERLMLTGVKVSCREGECGACTVIMNGKPTASCMVLACQADGAVITTIEGLADGDKLHPLQQAFIDEQGFQCGFCTPGVIMSSKALLDRNPDPAPAEVSEALNGHICRCGSYPTMMKAVLKAAKVMREEGK